MALAKILVTGSSGMLGREIIKSFQGHYEITGVSKSGREGQRLDLSSEKDVRSFLKGKSFDLVIHTAAYSDVDGCEADPQTAYQSNTIAPKNLSRWCDENKVPWIHVSTDYVFDGRKKTPYTETDGTGPVNIYGLSKWVGEYYPLHGSASCAVVRTSWLFGPHSEKNFVNVVLGRLQKEKEISVLDDQTDAPTSVHDLSLALGKIAEFLIHHQKNNAGKTFREIFHVCNSGRATRYEMTQWMRDCLGLTTRVLKADPAQIKERIALRPPRPVMSNEKFHKFFNMKMRTWKDSLKDYVKSGSVPCAS